MFTVWRVLNFFLINLNNISRYLPLLLLLLQLNYVGTAKTLLEMIFESYLVVRVGQLLKGLKNSEWWVNGSE